MRHYAKDVIMLRNVPLRTHSTAVHLFLLIYWILISPFPPLSRNVLPVLSVRSSLRHSPFM